MVREDSEIFIARTLDGWITNVFEYGDSVAKTNHSPRIMCLNCFEEHKETQPLRYVPEEGRFYHQKIHRPCYRDQRTKGNSHPLIQQTVLKQMRNSPQYSHSELEYPLKRYRGDNELRYDIGARLPRDDNLTGVVVEVQHQSGRFPPRLHPRTKTAHAHGYGIHIVFSSTARSTCWFKKQLSKMKGEDATFGTFDRSKVNLGSLIQPDDDISAFKVKSPN